MRYATLALIALWSMPASANDIIGFDQFVLGYESAGTGGSGDTLAGDSPILDRAFAAVPSPALNGEGSGTRFLSDVDQKVAIVEGYLHIPDETFTLIVGAGRLATRSDSQAPHGDEDGSIVSLQGRFRFSRRLALLLGVDHLELDADTGTNVYRGNLLMSDGATPVDVVFTYEYGDAVGSDDDAQTYGLGLRCNF